MKTRMVAPAASATAMAALLLVGCGGASGQSSAEGAASAPPTASPAAGKPLATPTVTTTLPGVGPAMTAKVPANARQALVVYGKGQADARSTIVLFTRADGMWRRGPSWQGHNGTNGWAVTHHENDRRSPIGVFTLHDAGGLLADPGSHMPYTRSKAFTASPNWPAAYQDDFDYVIAIDYNRVIGRPPSDPTRPLGESKGGSIWVHLDHEAGTSACVTVPKDAMRYLLRTLSPADHPVIVMGDTAHLAA